MERNRKWNPNHWENPVLSSMDDVLKYASQIDKIQGETVNDEVERCKSKVKARLLAYLNDDHIRALARHHDYRTQLLQIENNVSARGINAANRRAFLASVALAGAILSCIVKPPRFKVLESDDDIGTTRDGTDNLAKVYTHAHTLTRPYRQFSAMSRVQEEHLEDTQFVNEKYKGCYKEAAKQIAQYKNSNTSVVATETETEEAQKTRFLDTFADQITAQFQRDACEFDTCIVNDVDLHAELLQTEGERVEDILKNMRSGCHKSTVSSMTLAELALVCASW